MKLNCKLARAGACIVAAVAALQTQAASDIFLKIDTIEGESADRIHAGSSDILSWSWGMTGRTELAPVRMQPLTLRKRIDKASPLLMKSVADGGRFKRATLIVRSSGATQVEFARIVLEDVVITGILIGLNQDADFGDETITLEAARVGIEYFTITDTGKPGERTAFAWNLAENRPGGITFPGQTNPDADNDGMLDACEVQFGLNPAVNDARLDKDGDGATNFDEYQAGTSPSDANRVFKSSLSFVAGAQTATLSWQSAAGKTYRVLATDTLGSAFLPQTTVNSAGDGTTTATVPATAITRFFRVEVVP